jgi:hypothetical protein
MSVLIEEPDKLSAMLSGSIDADLVSSPKTDIARIAKQRHLGELLCKSGDRGICGVIIDHNDTEVTIGEVTKRSEAMENILPTVVIENIDRDHSGHRALFSIRQETRDLIGFNGAKQPEKENIDPDTEWKKQEE